MADPRTGSRVVNRPLISFIVFAICATTLGGAPGTAAAGPLVDCYISGPIGDMTWDPLCNWIMYGNVTVTPLATLRIEPGTSVLADPGVFLFVEGGANLVADGLEGAPITFSRNGTAITPVPWGGIQFNGSASGSVSWSTFDRVERAVTAIGSSPWISNNVVYTSTLGFAFVGSSAGVLQDNVVLQARAFGVYVEASDVAVVRNAINGTPIGIQVEQPGMPWISENTITNVSGSFAAGIFIQNGSTAFVYGNTIRGVRGTNGGPGTVPGARGRDGGTALGIYILNAPLADVSGNTVDVILGGNGGSGRENSTVGGVGGRGGDGGAAAGIAIGAASEVRVHGNDITTLRGGRGGVGGGGPATPTGGRGGDAGEAVGIQFAFTTGWSNESGNLIASVIGGSGGTGGSGTTQDGSGGRGGEGYGTFFLVSSRVDARFNAIQAVRGGFGGNSSLGPTSGNGAPGGDAVGVSVFSVLYPSVLDNNTVESLTGGLGGFGRSGGGGGNATGLVALGNNDGLFNATTILSNGVTALTGGAGGNGRTSGGAGGTASGIGVVFVTPTMGSNFVGILQGGVGGNSLPGGTGGKGGEALGIVGGFVLSGRSSDDSIESVTRGSAGTPGTPPASYARGFYLVGNATTRTRMTVENGTLASVGNFDFYVDNYTEVTTLNTTFTTVSIQAAGNLTVRNFLEVKAFWPNQMTLVTGARIRVEDGVVVVWDRIAPTGLQPWIVVTDRVYINQNIPTDNKTKVTVTYGSYNFQNNSRQVDMATSHTEPFVMVDEIAPTSAASALPRYRNTLTFTIQYTASDGDGSGLDTVTLWYRTREGGGWQQYGTQPAAPAGVFTFTAPGQGLYEFATTVNDTAGNSQPGPSQNQTWTIVDTTRPTSRVMTLAPYQTSLSFSVSWAPETGVTDIEKYKIQYRAAGDWVDWITTTSTSATFPAPGPGIYAFRSIATDHAGNTEIAPSGNDTWTIIDTARPYVSRSSPLGANTSRTPVIQITFSEPMNRTSVEGAFSIAGVTGNFTWNANSTVLTFLPSAPLAGSTSFTVVLTTEARDVAGNRMQDPLTFQFTTVSAPPVAGFAIADLWWLFLAVGAVLGGVFLLLMRRRAAAAPARSAPAPVAAPTKSSVPAIVEDLFLLNHRDGLLIKHETRRLRPDIDTDILTGMLTAVQAFVKDALQGDDYAELNEMTVGQMHILIGRGKWLVLAARIEGDGSQSWSGQIERCIKDMEDHHWDQLEDWDGDMVIARTLTPYLKKLIQGGYTLVEA